MVAWNHIIAVATMAISVSCSAVRETNTERTATEQLLLSHAVRASLAEIDLSPVDGKKVFLDTVYMKAIDQEFVVGEIRARLLGAGAALLDTAEDAELVVEARSAALGTDQSTINIGVPAIPIPVPAVGIIQTPELALLKNHRQDGVSSLALVGRDRSTGRLVFEVEPKFGRAIKSDWRFLGLRIYRNRKGLPPDVN